MGFGVGRSLAMGIFVLLWFSSCLFQDLLVCTAALTRFRSAGTVLLLVFGATGICAVGLMD